MPRDDAPPDAHVDAHLHLWDPGRLEYPWLAGLPRLHRRFGPEDLADDPLDPGPEAVVLVQAECRPEESLAEVRWFEELHREGLPVLGIVAHAPLERGRACAGHLAGLAARPLVSGVRRILQDEPAGLAASAGMVAGARAAGVAGLTVDLCVRAPQLREVVDLVARAPETVFVLDHLGKPVVDGAPDPDWRRDLAALARRPNVRCKLSGLATETVGTALPARPGDPVGDVWRPYLSHALDVFGPARCLHGSDWPVATTATTRRAWLDAVLEVLRPLTDAERALVLRGTARAVYGGRRRPR